METLAVVLVGVGLVGVGVGLVMVIRLRAEVGRLAERADRVAARVEALPPDLSRVFGNHDRHIISVELLNLFELAHRETWVARRCRCLPRGCCATSSTARWSAGCGRTWPRPGSRPTCGCTVSGSALLAAGLVLVVAAGLLLSAAARLRRRVRRTAWVLTRVAAAIGEAERAGRIRAELADTP